ncbi:MAG: hypothetical protein GX217_08240 [Clostridiaceae bacterium]|nr:hypothetical protein [Clostridiaceae bacterium]
MKTNILRKESILSGIKRVILTLLLPILLYLVLVLTSFEKFGKFDSFIMTINQSMVNLAIGWSMMFGISVNLFDFSVGSRLVLAGLIGVHFSQKFGLLGLILGCVVSSVLLGSITGLVFSILKVPSIITGFAVLLIFESLGVILSKNMVNAISSEHLVLAKGFNIYILIVLLFIFVYIMYNHTKFGFQIKAIGGNERVATSMGINTAKLKFLTYVLGGFLVGFATILYVSNAGTIQPKDGLGSMSIAFTPIMGVMLGMLIKSCNSVVGVFVGSWSITIIGSVMVAFGWESRLQNVIVGIFLIIVMGFQLNRDKLFKPITTKKNIQTNN